MFNKQSDILKHFFEQTHLGKMSLITLIQNLPNEKEDSNLLNIVYDDKGRYVKLNDDKLFKKPTSTKLIKQISNDKQAINDIIQQKTEAVSPALSIERKNSKLSLEGRYNIIANEFNLSFYNIEKQYELALKNRIEIPPILMRRILIDAINILHIIINELDQEKYPEKSRRILKRLQELETYNQLFDHHC